jgi:aminomethyltransferase
MVSFGGWDMPVQYSGILGEVNAVRNAAGLFEISHMGRLYVSGPRATEFLDWVLTGSVESLRVGRARYCMICNERGGIIDDTIYYRLAEHRYLLMPNADNRTAVTAWFQRWIDQWFPGACTLEDRTQATALLALQGPNAARIMDQICTLENGQESSRLRFFNWGQGQILGESVFIGRTGYTGEDGFEMVVDSTGAQAIWQCLLDTGAMPCGLGARDVLRLEAGLPLHGHEIDAETSPVEAGLERFVHLEKKFLGSQVVRQQLEHGVQRRLIGLTVPGRSAPRAGYAILDQGQEVGRVTSGTFSPTLDTSIAMGYVLVHYANPGQALQVDIRGRASQAQVVTMPFYTRPRRRPENTEGRSQSS